MRSYDVKLNGVPYVLAAPNGLALGPAPVEPGTPGQLATSLVGSMHGGIGVGVDEGQSRYLEAIGFNPTIPGLLIPEAKPVDFGSITASNLVHGRPSLIYQTGSKVFVTCGRTLAWFDQTATTPTLVQLGITFDVAWDAGDEFSGSGFLYNGKMIFGVVNDGIGVKHVEADAITPADATTHLKATNPVAYGASTRGKAFWIGNGNKLYWSIQGAGMTFPGTSIHGPQFINEAPPSITWIMMVGTSVILFTDGGEILGADETALWSIAGFTGESARDRNFGHHAKFWQDVLLIPAVTGLWTFTGQTLLTRAVSGNYIQAANVDRLRGEVRAVASAGPFALSSILVPGGEDHSRLYRSVKYAQGDAFHDFLVAQPTNMIVEDMITYYHAGTRQTRLYYIESYLVSNGDPTMPDLSLKYRNLRLPSDGGHDAANDLVSPASIGLLKQVGSDASQSFRGISGGSVTKMWLQVRGYWEKGDAGGAVLSFENVTVDGKACTIASVSASGEFSRPIVGTDPATGTLGRVLDSCLVKVTGPAYNTIVRLPLAFDYVWIPSNSDKVVLKLLVASDVTGNEASLWQGSARDASDALRALISTVVPLEFYDSEHGAAAWNVLVEGVTVENTSESGGVGQINRVATLQLRRL